MAPYQAINDAFNFHSVGRMTFFTFAGDYSVTRTILTDTDEPAFFGNHIEMEVGSEASAVNITVRPQSRGRLIDTLERPYENVTVSISSDPYLQ